MELRRVVVTGFGMVTPLGVGAAHNWQRLISCESGISAIESFDVVDLPCKIAGQVPRGTGPGQFDPNQFIEPKEQRKMDDFIHYALAAAQEAIAHSGYVPADDEQRERTGVLIGSGIGGLPSINDTALLLAEKGARRVSPFFIPAASSTLPPARYRSNTAIAARTTPWSPPAHRRACDRRCGAVDRAGRCGRDGGGRRGGLGLPHRLCRLLCGPGHVPPIITTPRPRHRARSIRAAMVS